MKSFKIFEEIRKLRISLILILLFFIGTLINMDSTNMKNYFGLIPVRTYQPSYWYSIITFSFIHGLFGHFLRDTIFILLLGLSIEKMMSQKSIIISSVVSVFTGAFVLTTMSEGDLPLFGANFLIYGYIGILITMWFILKNKFNLYDKIILILSCVLIIFLFWNFSVLLNKAFLASITITILLNRFYLNKELVS